MPTVEERMAATRARLGLRQQDVAEQAGVGRAAITRAEAGKSRLNGTNCDRIEAWLERNPPDQDASANGPNRL